MQHSGKGKLPDFIQKKIDERQSSDTPGRSADAPGRHRGNSEQAKSKANDIASRHKERAKGIAKSRGDAMKQPGPENS